ncbi:hypothetical protein HPU229334_00335 [Helicobacter pullorum]|uniref:Uncharacterized protein n=1 Tax=Helicobacter pullorum TaxID=35818 RepID=A0A0N1EAB3_9HELI|nr:hypothetical protein [Helicobacter pullorum]KPH54740.1 hypothetical protein HPU229334_00335 [Helicobacter pullorum]
MAKSIDFYGFFVVYWGAMSPTHSLKCVKNYKKAGQNSRNLCFKLCRDSNSGYLVSSCYS